MFVDNSGRRSRLLRRIGLLFGALSLGYAVVLGLAFMGIGVSSTTLLPFAGGPGGSSTSGPGGIQPQGGVGTPPALPTGTPPSGAATGAPPSAAPTATASAASN
ncbi:hypothetical protein [Streptomyces sp. NRRL B-24085]|uniref:hypothetical protein n=1 Tax=Streptomyces sp. NRRL B-24085 TaxID=1709476 RepID=UPI0006B326A9|nr:hypothetical protein [Streptomyces sp. NRRL B-24085]